MKLTRAYFCHENADIGLTAIVVFTVPIDHSYKSESGVSTVWNISGAVCLTVGY